MKFEHLNILLLLIFSFSKIFIIWVIRYINLNLKQSNIKFICLSYSMYIQSLQRHMCTNTHTHTHTHTYTHIDKLIHIHTNTYINIKTYNCNNLNYIYYITKRVHFYVLKYLTCSTSSARLINENKFLFNILFV